MKKDELLKMKKEHLEQKDKEKCTRESVSSCSCSVDDIQAIVFGGVHSRFWMLRKYFNSLNREQLNNRIPFYSWECISLCLPHRDIDIVIRDHSHMNKFLKFLIFALKTFDGEKNSAVKLIDTLNN